MIELIWIAIIGLDTTSTEEITDSNGNVVIPSDPGILQLDYTRLGSPILWSVCGNVLARIEALEAKLNSS